MMTKIKIWQKIDTCQLAVAFAVLNVVDATITRRLFGLGGEEAIPIAKAIINHSSMFDFMASKMLGGVAIAMIITLLCGTYHEQTKRISLGLVIGMTVVVCINAISCVYYLIGYNG